MSLAVVVLLLGVLPVLSIAAEMLTAPGDLIFLIGKWFVFWGIGVRMVLAGMRQTFNPEFTAGDIFQSEDDGAVKIVAELGISNLSIGVLGALAVFQPDWVPAAALCGGLFYGLAGAKHVVNRGRNRKQDVAMISDLAIFAVLAIYLAVSFVSRDLVL
jgi:Family of unknown function (DUF6790)